MSVAENFLRGLDMMDRIETRRVQRERDAKEYEYLQQQRSLGELMNQVEMLKLDNGGDPDRMVADKRFVGLMNRPEFADIRKSADGNDFQVTGLLQNPKTNKIIIRGNVVDADGNIVKQDVPITDNRTSDPKDTISQFSPRDLLGAADNALTKLQGYADVLKRHQVEGARTDLANQLVNASDQNQTPSTAFHARSAQAQVPGAPAPAPTPTAAPSQAQPAATPAQPVPDATPEQTGFDPAARLNSSTPETKGLAQRAKEWYSDANANNVAGIFKDLTADKTTANSRVHLQQIQSNPTYYADLMVSNPDAVVKAIGKSKAEEVRQYLLDTLPPDAPPREPLSKVDNWLPGRRNIKEDPTTRKQLAELQMKLPEGSKPLSETSEKTQKQLATAVRQMPKTDEGKKQVVKEGQSALQSIVNMRPGARVPVKLKKAAARLYALDPRSMPLDTLEKLVTTGRLSKRDIGGIRLGNDAVLYDRQTGEVVNRIKGTPSVKDTLAASKAYYDRLDKQHKRNWDRNMKLLETKAQSLIDRGKLDRELYPTKDVVVDELVSTILNNPDALAKHGLPDSLEKMSQQDLNYVANHIEELRSTDSASGLFSSEKSTRQQLNLQNMPTDVAGPDGNTYRAADWIAHAKANGVEITTPEELQQYMNKALQRGQ